MMGTKIKNNRSLVQYVGKTRLRGGNRVCNLTHRELFQMRDEIKKKRSEDAKKRAKNNWWVQKLIAAHRDAKRNGRPLGFARLTKPGLKYSGMTKCETELEWAMHGKGKPSNMKKLPGGGRHMKWD